MNKILDVSRHQGDINFLKMKEHEINGVMCRCAYSGSKDRMFDSFVNHAQKCGISTGAYAFCTWHYNNVSVNRATAMLAAESESNKVIDILKYNKITGPVAIDLELESGKSTMLSKSDMTFVANLYLKKLKDAGYTPMLYCSISWLFDKLICTEIAYPLWIAYYHPDGLNGDRFPNTKYGALMSSIKDKIWMWQYSCNGDGKSFGASSERIDLNHCYINFDITSKADEITKVESKLVKHDVYTVVKGDTLTDISRKYRVPISSIIESNPQIKNPNFIYIGQKINIPETNAHSTMNANNICVGCTVRVRRGARTFDGNPIASFVFSKTYTVDQIKGNRAVLDIKGICTPVNVDNLVRVN